MNENKITGDSRIAFRKLCLLSAKAVIRGHESAKLPFQKDWVWWMRDDFLSGLDSTSGVNTISSEGSLYSTFDYYFKHNLLQEAIAEKYESVAIWEKISYLSSQVKMANKEDMEYIKVSAEYGLRLHKIIAEAWKIMALGFSGDKSGVYDLDEMKIGIVKYDMYWDEFRQFQKNNTSCATLYKPYAFVYKYPNYHLDKGMEATIDKYRKIVFANNQTIRVTIQ